MGLQGAFLLLAVLSPVFANGALRHQVPQELATKVVRLLIDIDESVHKSGEDAEVVFAGLYTLDKQLETILSYETQAMSKTMTQLKGYEKKCASEVKEMKVKLQHVEALVQESSKKAGHLKAGEEAADGKFHRVVDTVQMLISVLQAAAITPNGALATPEKPDSNGEPARVFSAIRRLLKGNPSFRSQFPDVYQYFLTTSLMQLKGRSHSKAHAHTVRAPMTASLLSHTVAALQAVREKLVSQRSEVIQHLEGQERKFTKASTSALASADARQGVQGLKEQKMEDVLFSITFTQAVIKMDQALSLKLQIDLKKKAELLQAIRASRQSQLSTLKDLIDLLDGKYSAPGQLEGKLLKSAYAFFQARSHVNHPHQKVSSLQTEIMAALHNKKDTHAVLLKIHEALADTTPIDPENVQDVVEQLKHVAQAVDSQQSKAEDAKRKCEGEMFHAHEGEHQLLVSQALMDQARNHTKQAIEGAKKSLQDVAGKASQLERVAQDFMHTSTHGTKTLEDQSHDRKTILAALKKASEIAEQSLTKVPAAASLLRQMLMEVEVQDKNERAYLEQQVSFKSSFERYVTEYAQLLKERKSHYQGAISALELYSNEIITDASMEQNAVVAGQEVQKEGLELCKSILVFYDHHSKRRVELSKAVKQILPEIPEILAMGAEVSEIA